MPYYQLVGYNWNYWANREVSRVTKSDINHVTIRVLPFFGEDSYELYVSHRKTDTWVPTSVVERLNGKAVWHGREHQIMRFKDLEMIKGKAKWWKEKEPGNLIHPYFHHYIGRFFKMQAPWTCTRMCRDILLKLGHNVTEDFYPNKLVQEYIKEVF